MSSHADHDTWSTRRLLDWISGHLEAHEVHAPALVARMLVSHVLGGTDIELYTDPDRPASPQERERLRELVSRAASHEPVQYLIGRADFFGRSFKVDRSTLIPRSATESLVQTVLDWYRGLERGPGEGGANLRIVDLGTGTGCISITLACQLPRARVVATDVSPDALMLASENAVHHGVADRLEFIEGAGLDAVRDRAPFDAVCGNLPYVPDADWMTLDANVREHEPMTALKGGPEGLDMIAPVIGGALNVLRPGGLLVLEIDPGQTHATSKMAVDAGLEQVHVRRDEFGDERMLCGSAPISPDGS